MRARWRSLGPKVRGSGGPNRPKKDLGTYGPWDLRTRVLGALALTSVVALSGCARGCTSSRPPVHLNPSMDDQPKVRAQSASTFFFNGASMREPVPGTVAIDGLKEDGPFYTGKGPDGYKEALLYLAAQQ